MAAFAALQHPAISLTTENKIDSATIFGCGNPPPDHDASAWPGENLYADSLVLLDIDTV
jgi:hypothetical protein